MLNELKIVRPPLDSHVEKQHRIALHACEDDCMRGKSIRSGILRVLVYIGTAFDMYNSTYLRYEHRDALTPPDWQIGAWFRFTRGVHRIVMANNIATESHCIRAICCNAEWAAVQLHPDYSSMG